MNIPPPPLNCKQRGDWAGPYVTELAPHPRGTGCQLFAWPLPRRARAHSEGLGENGPPSFSSETFPGSVSSAAFVPCLFPLPIFDFWIDLAE